jgi:Permuted papain-like amidase enzyme, YaeF/YiiX, C92 family
MGWLRDRTFTAATRMLTKPRATYTLRCPNNEANLRTVVRKGDVVLVDGEQRVSEVIKFLTQSSWSHAAFYVGDELLRRYPERRAELTAQFGDDAHHMVIEALMENGVVASPLAKYARYNLRLCRPHGLRPADLQRMLDEVLAQIGLRYDVKNVIDLARYFFPVHLLPRRFHRRALEVGSGRPTEVICSSLIARAFQNVGFPILPTTEPVPSVAPVGRMARWWHRRDPYPLVFHRQQCALITPRDFDLSPYFGVVKFNAIEAAAFDYRRVRWG